MNQVGRFMFGIGAVIEHSETGHVLMLERNGDHSTFNANQWEFVYGRVAPSEEILDALRREIHEETGITELEVVRVLRVWHLFRGQTTPDKEMFGMTFHVRVQTQIVTLSPEHLSYLWVPAEQAQARTAVPGIQQDLELFRSSQATRSVAFTTIDGTPTFL